MRNQLFILLLIVLVSGCTSVQKITVTNLHDLASYQENSMIYSLPRTRLKITVEAVRHQTVPGPYYAYAERYLGIKGAPSISKDEYELFTVSMESFRESDPDYYYSLTSSTSLESMQALFDFSQQGLLLGSEEFLPFSDFYKIPDEKPEPIHYYDLSVKRNLNNDEKEKEGDAEVPVDLPVTKTKHSVKSIEVKAKEASDFIIKIRKRRFKLTAGQYDVFPEGMALEAAVRELDELEQEYLSLFVGKTYTDTVSRTYYYVPQPGEEIERNVICRFSDETGFVDANSSAGKPLVLELKSMNYTQALKQVQFPQTGPVYEDVIFYRIPEKAQIRLFYGSSAVIDAEEEIFQYGPLVPHSVSLLK